MPSQQQLHALNTERKGLSMTGHAMRCLATAMLAMAVGGADADTKSARETVLLTKDVSAYAGSDMRITVRALDFAPEYRGKAHRHPGPVVVCILEGEVE